MTISTAAKAKTKTKTHVILPVAKAIHEVFGPFFLQEERRIKRILKLWKKLGQNQGPRLWENLLSGAHRNSQGDTVSSRHNVPGRTRFLIPKITHRKH